jgi:hypothetical protein
MEKLKSHHSYVLLNSLNVPILGVDEIELRKDPLNHYKDRNVDFRLVT